MILWESADEDAIKEKVEVDSMLTQFLRPHQREGVQFMFECVTGLRPFEGQGIRANMPLPVYQDMDTCTGCILADDMGLGKTLQGITLMWTLLRQGADVLGGKPIAKRAIVVCPTSLVSNWEQECVKWLKVWFGVHFRLPPAAAVCFIRDAPLCWA